MKKLIILLTLILSVITSNAQNFSALNNDGDTIDIFGRYIKEINSNKTQIELDLSNIPEGNYIIKISNNGKQTVEKLIVK